MITKRIDRVTGLPAKYRTDAPPAPMSVKIELTARCNLNCFFCASAMRLRDKADMDFEFFKRIVRELKDVGVEELGVFYLGESFLCRWLPEAIKFAKEDCGFEYVFLTTNGIASTPERIRACIKAGLNSLKFSYNSNGPEQFHQVTGMDGKLFHVLVENIKAAREIRDEIESLTGHRCGLYASSIQYDGEQQERMLEAVNLIREQMDEHYFLPLYNQAGLIPEVNEFDFTPGNRGRIGALREPLPCWSIFTEGHITYDGHLSACCFDHDGRFHMGNLNEIPFMTGWHSEPFKILRRAHLVKDVCGTVCETCVLHA